MYAKPCLCSYVTFKYIASYVHRYMHTYLRYRSNATSHTCACTGLPTRVCKHVTHSVCWSTHESHLLHTRVTRGAAYMHVLLKWIQTCHSCVCVTCMYNCTCNTSIFYKTIIYVIMYVP